MNLTKIYNTSIRSKQKIPRLAPLGFFRVFAHTTGLNCMKPFLWHMKIHLPPVKTWYLRLLKAAKLSYLWTKLDTLTYYLRIGRLGLPVSLIEKSKLNYRYGVYRITLAIVGWDRGHSVRFLGTMKIKFYWKNISTIVIFEKKKFQIMCHMIGLYHYWG